jgi:hypothetical protein
MCKITDWNLANIDRSSNREVFLKFVQNLPKLLEKESSYTIKDQIHINMIQEYYCTILGLDGASVCTKSLFMLCAKTESKEVLDLMRQIMELHPCTESKLLYENMKHGFRKVYGIKARIKTLTLR